MTDEQLKGLWQHSSESQHVEIEMPAFIKGTQLRLKKLEKDIKTRDRREIMVAIVLIPVFATIAWFITPLLSKVGALLVIPYALFVIYRLRMVERYKVQDYSVSLKEYLSQQRVYLYQQMKLLDNVLYWYLLPAALPLLLFFIGQQSYLLCVAVVPLLVVIHYINRKEAKEVFQPLIAEVDDQIKELESQT